MNPPFHPSSVCPSANLSPFHQPHTETRQWGPHPSSVSHDNSALLGACIFYTGAPVSVFVHFFPKLFIIYYLLYKHLYLQSVHSLSSPLATCFFLAIRNPCHPWIGAVLIIYPCRHCPYLQSTPQVSYLYPLNLFTLSRLWHNLALVLSSP
jgi:hypothetical protein